jgi:NAD(P)-dependent dehydrogenase (short-subunit alcohol dehydrogenase family)
MPSIGEVPPQTNSTRPQTHIRIRRQTECRNQAALIGIFNAVEQATAQVDIAQEQQVRQLFAAAGPVDHVVVTAVDPTRGYAPIDRFELADAQAMLTTKLIGAWLVAKHAKLPPTGSLAFTSGIAACRPGPGSSIIASANGGVEALARSLALELAPTRVNVVSPGWVDTPIWSTLAGAAKDERLAGMAARLPVGRVGRPADIAAAFAALIGNGYITGTVLHVDGGQQLV